MFAAGEGVSGEMWRGVGCWRWNGERGRCQLSSRRLVRSVMFGRWISEKKGRFYTQLQHRHCDYVGAFYDANWSASDYGLGLANVMSARCNIASDLFEGKEMMDLKDDAWSEGHRR